MANEFVRIMDESAMTPEALAKENLLLIDFWAPWCGPCRMMAPVIDQIAEHFKGKLTVGKVNIDECESAAVSFGIASIPTLILMKNGREVERLIGARPYAQLVEILQKYQ